MDLVSIVIPAYNAEHTIARCLDSIVRQRYENIEILVVDDGSVDATAQICGRYAQQDERIQLIVQTNQGVVSARTTALQAAKGKYIAFVDADDEIKPDMIAKLVSCIEADGSDMAICGYDIKTNEQHTPCTSRYTGVFTGSNQILALYMQEGVLGFLWNKLYKKSLFDQVVWDYTMEVCEDLYANCYLVRNVENLQVSVLSETLYIYCQNNLSVTHSMEKKIDSNGDWKYIKAYEKIMDLFPNESKERDVIQKAYLIGIRLGIEELIKEVKYIATKKKLQNCGRKNIGALLKSEMPIKYKIGWMIRVLCG